MKVLFILNDPPYDTERVYNALRLANTLLKKSQTEMTVFLMADSVVAAKAGQNTPDGYFNVERTLEPAGHSIAKSSCGPCMDARGLDDTALIKSAQRAR